MVLSKDEVNFYNDQGYLLVEDVISKDQHNEMLALVKDFFEKSKIVNVNDTAEERTLPSCTVSLETHGLYPQLG